ncbi:hypothetical protein PG993_002236 [Apiospora rasikravindrae]|uniref:Secreted protein n=1 Tax=Apiospora rasikravindrae TaxID=990691 RepID=A0ABR1TW16_9PEZI
MTSKLSILLLAATVVFGAPASEAAPDTNQVAARTEWHDFSGKLDADGNKVSRRAFHDYTGRLDKDGHKISRRSLSKNETEAMESGSITKRDDFISSCGRNYVPVNNFSNKNRDYTGYKTAVDRFCMHITRDWSGESAIVRPGAYAGTTIYEDDIDNHRIGISNGKNPTDDATTIVPGHIEFEIHNKQETGDHKPDLKNCKEYLMHMASPGTDCYGPKNVDTKGGTWQMKGWEGVGISYHALPGEH